MKKLLPLLLMGAAAYYFISKKKKEEEKEAMDIKTPLPEAKKLTPFNAIVSKLAVQAGKYAVTNVKKKVAKVKGKSVLLQSTIRPRTGPIFTNIKPIF